jgi:hypothetical protein
LVTSLSKLVDMIQSEAVPSWLRDEVVAHRDEIAKALEETGVYELNGPGGLRIEIRADKAAAA